jgi:hypothetical protein
LTTDPLSANGGALRKAALITAPSPRLAASISRTDRANRSAARALR